MQLIKEQYTFGFEFLKDHVKNMTPEWAYPIIIIKPKIATRPKKKRASGGC